MRAVCCHTGGLAAANLNTWIDYGLAMPRKYPNLKLVTERIPTDEKQQEAYRKTLDLLGHIPTSKGIVGVTPGTIGAAQAVEEQGLQDKVAVVGSACPLTLHLI